MGTYYSLQIADVKDDVSNSAGCCAVAKITGWNIF